MKNLLIMRHAKSDWDSSSVSDFERPLNNRGKNAAPIMGNELIKKNKVPDLIISSPANRAKTTAEMVAKAIAYNNTIQFENEFYFGYLDEIISIIKKTDNLYQRIMIVGHNPTLEDLLVELSNKDGNYTMPTAAIASLIFDIDNWKDLHKKNGKLEFIIIPKDLAT